MAKTPFKVDSDEGDGQTREATCLEGLAESGAPVVDPTSGTAAPACGWSASEGDGDGPSVKAQARDHVGAFGHTVRVRAVKETLYTGTPR